MRHLGKTLLLVVVVAVVSAGDAPGQRSRLDPFKPGAAKQNRKRTDVMASVEFVNTPITTIFKMISDLTGWSIVMSPDVSKTPPRINIWVKDLTPAEVLEQVIALGNLVQERKGNTIRIMTFDEYTRLYGVEKRILQLEHANAKDVASLLKPYVAKTDQARIVADDAGNRLILLVPKPLLDSLTDLARGLDQPFEGDAVEVVSLKHLEASQIVPVLETFLTRAVARSGVRPAVRTRTRTGTPATAVPTVRAGEGWLVQFMVESKLNIIVLRGLRRDVEKTVELIAELDVPPDIQVKSYILKHTNARDVFATVERIVQETRLRSARTGAATRLRLALSEPSNRIIVEGSPADHKRLVEIIEAVDQALPPGTGGIRVYRLENTSSAEVTKVLQALVDAQVAGQRLGRGAAQRGPAWRTTAPGVHRVGSPPAATPPRPQRPGTPAATPAVEPDAGDVLPPRITDAPEINAVIIRASAAEHDEFAGIIRELDQARPQVMLEVTLVSVRSRKGLDLGLELGAARIGQHRTQGIGFSHFGIAEVDPETGTVKLGTPTPFGLNVGIFNSGDFFVVLNALKQVGDTRISSAPKVLAEDNQKAEISQVNQEPFEIVNQGETTTTTSFGGFVDAGTVMSVTPHVSQGDWLRLEYEVDLSSFGERVAVTLPPPRLQNHISGTVRVPAEHTIVLGGLVASRESQVEDSIPILSDLPVLGELFKSRSKERLYETLFVFIRPVVLRDPAFRDLMFLSREDIKQARIADKARRCPVNPMKRFARR